VYKSEHSRIRGIKDNAGLLLASSGICIGLVSRGLVEAWSTKPGLKFPGVIAITSLGVGVAFALRVTSIVSYSRLDTAFLRKGSVLAMPSDECAASLVATRHEVAASIEERTRRNSMSYKVAQVLTTVSIIIVLFIMLTMLGDV
jgi:hypothetical protein